MLTLSGKYVGTNITRSTLGNFSFYKDNICCHLRGWDLELEEIFLTRTDLEAVKLSKIGKYL